MRNLWGSVGASVVLLSALSGCFGGDGGVPDHLIAAATQPLFMTSYSYDGTAVVVATGTANLDVTETSATGSLNATVTVGGTRYDVEWTRFVGDPARAFQKQGIARDFQEHGASGVGDSNLPEMHLLMAGWGPATVTAAGTPLADPLTGTPTLTGHFMVTDTGVWDDSTHRVTTADGAGVFSPGSAADGRALPDDLELHVLLRSDPNAAVVPDNTTEASGSIGPQPSATAAVQFEVPSMASTVVVSVSVGPPEAAGPLPIVPGDINVTLQDPSGATIKGAELGGQGQTRSVEWTLDPVPAVGNYVVSFTNTLGAASWQVTTAIDNPEPVFLYFVFEDVTVDSG